MTNVYLYDFTESPDKDKVTKIHAWGKTEDGKSVCVRINGHSYVSTLLFYHNNEYETDPALVKQLTTTYINNYNSKCWKKNRINPSKEYKAVTTLYYGLNAMSCRLTFTTKSEHDRLKYVKVKEVSGGGKTYKVQMVDTIVPYLNKFFGEWGIAPGTWVRINVGQAGSKVSKCDMEFSVRPTDIERLEDQPSMPVLKLLQYDLEVYSANRTFPKAYRPGDKVIVISTYLKDSMGNGESVVQFALGKTDPARLNPKAIVHEYENEELMIQAFLNYIAECDPELITGYNIFGFDNEYMHDRHTLIHHGHYGNLGRTDEYPSQWKGRKGEGNGYSSKTGISYNNDKYINMPGRIYLDMYTVMKREHKLKKYSLEEVAQILLGEGKIPMDYMELFDAFEAMVNESPDGVPRFTDVVNYAIKDAELVYKLIMKKNTLGTMFQFAQSFGILPQQVYVGGQQIKTVSRIYKHCCKNNIVINPDIKPTRKYQGAYVGTPCPGRWFGVICDDFSGMYPSIIIRWNICYSTFIRVEDRHKYKDEDVYKITADTVDPTTNKPYEHWYVREHIRKGVLPTILEDIVAFRAKIKVLIANAPDAATKARYMIAELAVKVIANSIYGIMGAQGEFGKLPFVPGAESVTAQGKKDILKVNDYVDKKANGQPIYNDTDSVFYVLRYKPDDLFAEAKRITEETNKALFDGPVKIALEKIIDVIFYDIKKNYIYMLLNDKLEHVIDTVKDENGKEVTRTIEGVFGDRLNSYEGVMGIINSPKDRALIRKAIKSKGDALTRRDKFEYLVDTYTDIVIASFFGFTFEQTIALLIDRVEKLYAGEVPPEKLYKVTTYNDKSNEKKEPKLDENGNPKPPRLNKKGEVIETIPSVVRFVTKLRSERDINIESGTRFEYVVLAGAKKSSVSDRMCMVDMLPENYEIDYDYYAEKMINSIDVVVRNRFHNERTQRIVNYKVGACNPTSIFEPMKLLHQLYSHNVEDAPNIVRKLSHKKRWNRPTVRSVLC